MCYYNGVKVTHSEFIRLKTIEKALAKYDFLNKPLIIGFEYSNAPVLKKEEGKKDFDIVQMEWGFLPSPDKWPFIKTREDANKMRHGYTDDTGKFRPPITTLNAISEELLLPNKIYREAALKRRCLVLSTGFYDWRHVYPKNKKTGEPLKTAVKYPYRIGVKEREYFFMAGVGQPWEDTSTGEYVETFAIVTTKANKLMEQVHNSKKRMPTILDENLAWEWLMEDLDEKRILEIAKYQFSANLMEAYSLPKDFLGSQDPTAPGVYPENVLPPLELVS